MESEPRYRKRQREERVALTAQHEVKRYCTEQSRIDNHVLNLANMLKSKKYGGPLEDRVAVITDFLNYIKVYKTDIMSLCKIEPRLQTLIVEKCGLFKDEKEFPELVAVAIELLRDFSD